MGAGDRVPSNLPIDGHSFRRVEVLTGTPRRRRWSAAEKAAIVAESQAPGAQTWLNRPIARCSDKVSAIFAKPAASEMLVKQFPSLVKTVPALRAWQATYSWPFNIIWEGVAADLDRQVAPVAVEDVERVVVDKGDRLLSLDVVIGADIPHRRAGASDQDQKQAMRDVRLGQIFFGKLVFALPCRTVDHRDAVRSGVTAHSATKPAGQPPEVGVLERLVRSGQRSPPQSEPTRIMPRSEIGVENDPVDAIVAAAQ